MFFRIVFFAADCFFGALIFCTVVFSVCFLHSKKNKNTKKTVVFSAPVFFASLFFLLLFSAPLFSARVFSVVFSGIVFCGCFFCLFFRGLVWQANKKIGQERTKLSRPMKFYTVTHFRATFLLRLFNHSRCSSIKSNI